MEKNLVTVFIPVFNAFEYIEETLNSVINQSYKNLEILIINDGSTDGTLELISSIKDSRIRIIDNVVNRGLPFTRNLGLTESKGEYIAFLDADDIVEKKRISKQVLFLNENKNVDLVFSNMGLVGKKKVSSRRVMDDLQIKYKLLFRNIIGNSSVMVRKESITQYKIVYNNKYFVAQDYRFWIDCIPNLNFGYIPETLVYYRKSDTNITSQSYKDEKKFNQRLKLINEIHENALVNIDIKLTSKQRGAFNEIFNESKFVKNRNLNNIKQIYILLRDERILDKVTEKVWINVLNEEIMVVLLQSNEVKILDIGHVFLRIMKNKTIYNYFYLIRIIILRLVAGKR